MSGYSKRDINDVFTKPKIGSVTRRAVVLDRDYDVPDEVSPDKVISPLVESRKIFESAIDISNEVINEIDKQCSSLKIVVDYEKHPELYQAMLIVFGEAKPELTYADYVAITEEIDKMEIYKAGVRMGF